MLIERVVINASPLIILFRGHLESLLSALFSEIYVPAAVWSEVTGGGYRDESVSGLINAERAKRVKVSGISPSVAAWDLGIGESEVLSFALERPGFRAMVDDKAARRCAKTLGIQTLGTGGMLVLVAKQAAVKRWGSAVNLYAALDMKKKFRNVSSKRSDSENDHFLLRIKKGERLYKFYYFRPMAGRYVKGVLRNAYHTSA